MIESPPTRATRRTPAAPTRVAGVSVSSKSLAAVLGVAYLRRSSTMHRTFPRHTFEGSLASVRTSLQVADEELADAFTKEVLDLWELDAYLQHSLTAMPYRALLNPNDPAILDDLKRMACGAAGVFSLNEVPAGEEITVTAPNKEWRRGVSIGPKRGAAHVISWQLGFFAALAAREREATEVLTQVSEDTLRKGQAKAAEWFYASFHALQAFVRKRSDAEEKLVAAMKATDPDTCHPADRDYVLDIAWPVLELAWHAFRRDNAAFDEAMWKALEGHRHYYTKTKAKRDVLGVIALRPLAMAVWAKDLGVTTTIESDYIPRWIIDR